MQLRRLWPLAVFGVALAAYLLTLTGVHTFDAYSYAAAVQTKPLVENFHPHHLLYGPLGWLAYALARGLGYAGMALLPLQAMNALAGAVGVALWAWLVRRETRSLAVALLAAAALGGGYAWWRYAVEVEVYTLAALFLIWGLALLLRLLREPTWAAGWLWLGLAHAGAMLFHQTNVLWGLPVLIAWWSAAWPSDWALGRRLGLLGRYLAVGAGLVGGLYAWVMFGVSGFRSLEAARAWLFDYAATGFWGGTPSLTTLADLGRGWSLTLAPWAGPIALLILVAWLVSALRRHIGPRERVLLAWIAVYTLFFAWWEADNIEFWIALLPPALFLAALALPRSPRALGLAALWVALISAPSAARIVAEGDPRADADRQTVASLAAAGAPEDLYLVPNGLQELYLRYEFGRTNVLALSLGMGDWERGCATLQEAIVATRTAGYAVWVDQALLDPPQALLERYQLDSAAVAACFAPFALAAEAQIGATRYARLAPAAAEEPDWRWSGWTLGWRPNGLDTTTWADGWRFVPADDPHLVSPPLALDAAAWSALEVTLATSLPDQQAQLYWIAPGAQATEERSVAWPLIGDGSQQTYRIELADLPTWEGPIELLRLDPVTKGDGAATVTLIRLRLLP